MQVSERVRLAASFALLHAADGFTNRMLAEALDCSNDVARYTRLEPERQLAGSPIQLLREDGWLRIDPDNTYHDVRRYCLKPR
jgi:hypothetical protein